AGARFIDALQMIFRLVNIGDAKSLACHPASTTHRQLSPEELKRAGVSEDMVRTSVGIEQLADIIADVEEALAPARGQQSGPLLPLREKVDRAQRETDEGSVSQQ